MIRYSNAFGIVAAVWGTLGFLLLLVFALIRLTPNAIEALTSGLTPFQWLIVVAWSLFMLRSEGYDGFQKRFGPRFANRIKNLYDNPRLLHTLLAPLYGMHFYAASRKRIITAWSALFLILIFVQIIHQLPQPWRGIVDCGVILGLSYGFLVIMSSVISIFKRNK